MSQELTKQDDAVNQIAKVTWFTPEDVETMKNTVFTELKTASQFKMALAIAKKYDLDPFAKEIWGWIDKQWRLIIITSASWIAKIIRRQEWFKSLVAQAVYPEDEFEIDPVNNSVTHKIKKREASSNPLWAYAILKIWEETIIQWVDWHEYAPAKIESRSVWARQKSAMIQKCAITVLWRQSVWLSWIYWEEEIDKPEPQNIPEWNVEIVNDWWLIEKIQACENVKELQGLAPEIKKAGSKEILATYSVKLQELWSK